MTLAEARVSYTDHDAHIAWRQRVARAFDRAAPHYDRRASAQHDMGQHLWESLPAHATRILDLGCGPGQWTDTLACHYPDAQVVGVDLSSAMLDKAKQAHCHVANWVCADAAHLPFPHNQFDLIFSNLAIQWCDDLVSLFAALYRILAPGGIALINTLVPGTLAEIDHAWSRPGQPAALLTFHSIRDYQRLARVNGFTSPRLNQRRCRFHYPDLGAVMASIKGVGAQVSRPGGQLTRGDVARAAKRYELLREPPGLPVTYELLTLSLTKPS